MPSHPNRVRRSYCDHQWPDMNSALIADFPDMEDGRKCILCNEDWDVVHNQIKKQSQKHDSQ